MTALAEHPFTLIPSPRYLNLEGQYELATVHALTTITNDLGLYILAGEVGCGKTSILRHTIDRAAGIYGDKLRLAYIPNPNVERPMQLLKLICDELGVPSYKNRLDQDAAFKNFLLDSKEEGYKVVLVVDEAQKLKGPQLDLLNDFFNYNTNEGFLLSIIIAGEAQSLLKKLAYKKALKSRAMFLDELKPLTVSQVSGLLRFRLRLAHLDEDLFSHSAVEAMQRVSEGVPRNVVKLAYRLLGNEPAQWARKVSLEAVEAVSLKEALA